MGTLVGFVMPCDEVGDISSGGEAQRVVDDREDPFRNGGADEAHLWCYGSILASPENDCRGVLSEDVQVSLG